MGVFDKSGFAERARQDKLASPAFKPKNTEWSEGFDAGYKSALDRYIPLTFEEVKGN